MVCGCTGICVAIAVYICNRLVGAETPEEAAYGAPKGSGEENGFSRTGVMTKLNVIASCLDVYVDLSLGYAAMPSPVATGQNMADRLPVDVQCLHLFHPKGYGRMDR